MQPPRPKPVYRISERNKEETGIYPKLRFIRFLTPPYHEGYYKNCWVPTAFPFTGALGCYIAFFLTLSRTYIFYLSAHVFRLLLSVAIFVVVVVVHSGRISVCFIVVLFVAVTQTLFVLCWDSNNVNAILMCTFSFYNNDYRTRLLRGVESTGRTQPFRLNITLQLVNLFLTTKLLESSWSLD